MSHNPGKPSRETLAKTRKGIEAGNAYVDSLPPDERAAEITRMAQLAADRATDPNVSYAELLAELDD